MIMVNGFALIVASIHIHSIMILVIDANIAKVAMLNMQVRRKDAMDNDCQEKSGCPMAKMNECTGKDCKYYAPEGVYTDTTSMAFGKHRGKALVQVPAQYLLWLADQDKFEKKQPKLSEYIERRRAALEAEAAESSRK